MHHISASISSRLFYDECNGQRSFRKKDESYFPFFLPRHSDRNKALVSEPKKRLLCVMYNYINPDGSTQAVMLMSFFYLRLKAKGL